MIIMAYSGSLALFALNNELTSAAGAIGLLSYITPRYPRFPMFIVVFPRLMRMTLEPVSFVALTLMLIESDEILFV